MSLDSHHSYFLDVRFKLNQKNAERFKIPEQMIRDDMVSLEDLDELLKKVTHIEELQGAKIRYLDDQDFYVPLPESGVPFNGSKCIKLYLSVQTQNPLHDINFLRQLKESKMDSRLEVLEQSVQQLKSAVLSIAQRANYSVESQTISGSQENQTIEEEEEDKAGLSLEELEKYSANLSNNFTKSRSITLPEANRFIEPPLSKRITMSHFQMKKSQLHFAILYSNPLVELMERRNKITTALLTNDPVDFSSECSAILNTLQSFKKHLNVHVECASSDQFINIIKEKPKVMHIMCHGDFDVEKQEYFLEFENSKAELLRMYPSKLKELLAGTSLSDIELVFINACHSEALGRAFLELGVKTVIVSQSEHKLNDEFAKNFGRLFYNELIEAKSISQAFKNAKVQLKALKLDSYESCCCGHSHTEDCEWYAYYKQHGKFLAHAEHECLCNCPQRAQHIHQLDCQWAEEFMFKFNLPLPDPDADHIFLCCCRPELTHDETMKLQLLCRKGTDPEQQIIFGELFKGEVRQVSKTFFSENKFQDCETVGRNRVIYQVFNAFCYENARIVYLVGESGIGKSQLSKHIANYMMERHKVANVTYLNMDRVFNLSVFLARIPEYRLITSFGTYKAKSAGQENLIILDNLDGILERHYKEFHVSMRELVEQTKLRFLVLSKTSYTQEDVNVHWQQKVIGIPPLNTQAAAKLLKSMASDYLPFNLRNIVNLQSHPIFKSDAHFSLKPTPKVIADISFILKKGNKSLDQIYEDYCLKQSGSTQVGLIEDQSMLQRKSWLEAMKTQSHFQYQVYLFIAHFNNGIMLRDLKDAAVVLPLPEDWLATVIYISLHFDDEFIESQTSFVDLKQRLFEMLKADKTEFDILKELKKTETSSNSAIKINDMKLSGSHEICLSVDIPMRQIINTVDEDGSALFQQKINVLRYYQFLFQSIIIQNTKKNYYLENILECSLVNSNKAVWEVDLHPQQIDSYVVGEDMSISELQDIIKIHETTIRVLLSDSSEMSLCKTLHPALESSDPLAKSFLNLLQGFLLMLWTICKIHEYYEIGLDYVQLFRQMNSTEESQKVFRACEIKAELFACDVLYRKLKKSRDLCSNEDAEQISIQFNIAERVLQSCEAEDWINYYSEFYIAKILTLKLDKIKLKNRDQEIETCYACLKNLADKIPLSEKFHFLKAKINFFIFENHFEKKIVMEKDIARLKEAVNIFQQAKSHKLECHAFMMLATLYSNKHHQSLNYAKEALKLSRRSGIKEFEKQLKALVNTANTQIRKQFQNKLYFLKSFPLKDQPEPPCGGINFSKNLRYELNAELAELHKHILVHFDTFKLSVLKELFEERQGCKLLALDFLYLKDDALVLEGSQMNEEVVDLPTLKELIGSSDKKISADILMVLSDYPYKIITEFADICKIPVTIYFDFKQKEQTTFRKNCYDIKTHFLKREFMYVFLKTFVKELCSGKQVKFCLDNALGETFEKINHSLKHSYELLIVKQQAEGLDLGFTTTRGMWSISDLEEIFKDSVKVHFNPKSSGPGLNMVCELSKGTFRLFRQTGRHQPGPQRCLPGDQLFPAKRPKCGSALLYAGRVGLANSDTNGSIFVQKEALGSLLLSLNSSIKLTKEAFIQMEYLLSGLKNFLGRIVEMILSRGFLEKNLGTNLIGTSMNILREQRN